MACPETFDLCFVADNTLTIDFTYEPVGNMDLTGATAEMQLLDAVTDPTEVIDMSGGFTDTNTGQGAFSLTRTQTQGLLPIGNESSNRVLVGDIRVIFADTTARTIARGNITIEQGANR